MGECTACGNKAKYKCPACGTSSCSLDCVRTHKQLTSCTGLLDPTRRLSHAELLTAPSLDRDYNFLQRIGRDIQLEHHSRHTLGRVAKPRQVQRAGVRVRTMPRAMPRARQNRSGWSKTDREYIWTVELDGGVLVQCPESRLVRDIAEGKSLALVDADGERHELLSDITLGMALKGHTIIEFPRLSFSLVNHMHDESKHAESSAAKGDSSCSINPPSTVHNSSSSQSSDSESSSEESSGEESNEETSRDESSDGEAPTEEKATVA